MSPEQARGKPVDHRSDLFSMGIILYQMATGRLPFKGESDVESLSATLTQEASPLSELVAGVPAEAERVVRKALEKDPASRYQHADDLATDLRNLKRDLDSGRASIPSEIRTGPISGVATTAPAGWALPRWSLPVAGLLAIMAVVLGYIWISGREASPEETAAAAPGTETENPAVTEARMKIVVLPFENLGASEDEFFAAGITEELINKLALVRELGVTSRSSAFRYDRSAKSMRQIGDDFGVEYVLDGTVRWAKPTGGTRQVRISPQLVRISDDTSLWAGTYDRTMDNIFEIQSEIAGEVINQLGVVLLDSERSAVDSRPTDNAQAYQAYLKGRQYLALAGESEANQRLAVQLLQRAVEFDPGFVQAHAALSRSHAALVHWGYERTNERKNLARGAAERALRLAPEAPEAHLAMGYYHYWCNRNYGPALEEFAVVRQRLPRSTDLLVATAYVERRQGEWASALAHFKEAATFSPTDSELSRALADTLLMMRRYEEALAALDRTISLSPDLSLAYVTKAMLHWQWTGNLQAARAALESKPPTDDPVSLSGWYWQEIYEGNYQAAVDRLDSSSVEANSDAGAFMPKILWKALAFDLMERKEEAREAFDETRTSIEALIRERPDDFRLYGALGIALAGLGRKEEAVAAGKKGAALYPLAGDALAGTEPLAALAFIHTLAGDDEAALDTYEIIFSIPSGDSPQQIRLDPWSASLVSLPRFAQLERRTR